MPDEQDELIEQTNQELQDTEFRLGYGEEIAKVDFALALTKARKAHNLTQHQLAEALEVTQPYIARLERGEANPTIATVGRIFAAMWDRLVWSTRELSPEGDTTSNVPVGTQTVTATEGPTNRFWSEDLTSGVHQVERFSYQPAVHGVPRAATPFFASVRMWRPVMGGTADDSFSDPSEQTQGAKPSSLANEEAGLVAV